VRRHSAVFVFITVLLDAFGMGLIFPVAPRLVASFLGNDLGAASHWYGLLISLFAIMQFFFSPILGGLSDRFGRRPVILLSLGGAVCSYLLSAFAPRLSWLFVGRIAAGATAASMSVANAYVADVTPPEKRAQTFGAIGAAMGLGFIVGPAVGGALGDVHLRLPYFVSAGLNGLNLLYGLFVLPESLRRENRRPFSLRRSNTFGSLQMLGRNRFVFGLTAAMLCSAIAPMIMQSVWALHVQSRFGWSLRAVGVSFMAMGVATVLAQGLLIRVVMPRLGERRMLIAGLLMAMTAFCGFGLANRGWLLYVCILPMAAGRLAGPATQALITREVGPEQQGEIQGVLTGLMGLPSIVGPLIGTTLLSRFGVETSVPHVPGAPFFAAATVTVAALTLVLRLFARSPERARQPRSDDKGVAEPLQPPKAVASGDAASADGAPT
jgi:MFS transporter, DHA1 family, tetracycline resistance protein